MSSNLLEDIELDVNGSKILFSIKLSGDAFLSIFGAEESSDYHFFPDKKGLENAQKIINAINCWIEHTKDNLKK